MNVMVHSAGSKSFHLDQRDFFCELARADEVGRHRLAQRPDDADVLLFVDTHQHPGDPLLKVLRNHPLVRRYPGKAYVYDERDRPFVTLPGIYVSASARMARRWPVAGGAYPWLPTPTMAGSGEPDLLFSFRGARTHHVRDVILGLKHSAAVIEDSTDLDFFRVRQHKGDRTIPRAQQRYAEVVARSKFVLCPRGHGPSSFRLYETLAAGRVPVVISDQWLAPPDVCWSRMFGTCP